ncbi:MAG TPA: hypothetical protein VMY77_16860 [Chitinophagaceae bacterium]|nr:hypothetical protein [Chitinophagaceae bacterium]
MRLIHVILFFLLLFNTPSYSQGIQKTLLSAVNKDSLRNIYGINKEFITEYELQSLVALSFYPELINTRITFKLADKESVAKTTISFSSVFNSGDKHFFIYINNNKSSTGLLLNDASFQAQVGAIGHELAHAADFDKKNLVGMVSWGIKYLFKRARMNIERKTDISTIQHGLGMELYYFVDFVLNHSTANSQYKKFKRLNYLTPAEIVELTKSSDQHFP